MSFTKLLSRYVAGGDLHVTKRSSTIMGIVLLLVYVIITATMVYFEVNAIMVLFSILAFFSLTTSYVIPTVYKLRKSRTKPKTVPVSSIGKSVASDINIDFDFKGRVPEDQKADILKDYFANQYKEQDSKQKNKGLELKLKKTKSNRNVGTLLLDFILIALFAGMYGLIIFNFIYHTVKQFTQD